MTNQPWGNHPEEARRRHARSLSPSPVAATSRKRTPSPTTAVQPVASPAAVTRTQGAAQTLRVVATAGDPLVPLDPAATRLEAPAGATVDAAGTVVVVHGEGRYELDRTASTVAFKLDSIGNDCACAFLRSVVNRQLGRGECRFRFRFGVRVLSWVS